MTGALRLGDGKHETSSTEMLAFVENKVLELIDRSPAAVRETTAANRGTQSESVEILFGLDLRTVKRNLDQWLLLTIERLSVAEVMVKRNAGCQELHAHERILNFDGMPRLQLSEDSIAPPAH